MNWLVFALKALQMVPVVVAGVEAVHTNLSGSAKKEQALTYLGLGSAVASQLDPKDTDTFNTVNQAVGQAIDATVSIANAVGQFTKKSAVAPTPAPAQ